MTSFSKTSVSLWDIHPTPSNQFPDLKCTITNLTSTQHRLPHTARNAFLTFRHYCGSTPKVLIANIPFQDLATFPLVLSGTFTHLLSEFMGSSSSWGLYFLTVYQPSPKKITSNWLSELLTTSTFKSIHVSSYIALKCQSPNIGSITSWDLES